MSITGIGRDSALHGSFDRLSISSDEPLSQESFSGKAEAKDTSQESYESREYKSSYRHNPSELGFLGGDSAFEMGFASEASSETSEATENPFADNASVSSLSTSAYSAPTEAQYMKGHNRGIWRVIPLSSEKVVSLSYDKTAKVWDMHSKTCIKTLTGHKGEVLSGMIYNDSLITGDSSGIMRIWNKYEQFLEKQINEPIRIKRGFYSMCEIGANRIATGSCQKPKGHKGRWDHVIKLWNVEDRRYLGECEGHTGGISALVKLEDAHIASCSADKSIRIWNTVSFKEDGKIEDAHKDYIYGMCSLSKREVITGSRDRLAKIWDLETLGHVMTLETDQKPLTHESTIYDVCKVSSSIVATCSRDTYVKLWDRRQKKVARVYDPDDGFVYGLCCVDKSKIVASTSGKKKNKGSVVLWDLKR